MEQDRFRSEVLPLRELLMGYSLRLLSDAADAEDVVQEVFLKMWDMRADLGKYDSVKAFALQTTRNQCLNRIKVRSRTVGEGGIAFERSTERSPHMALEQKDGVMRVMGLIEGLPETQRIVLKMRHVEGLEVEEIAGLTGCSPDAVRMNLSRARKRIKELFVKTEIR